MALTYLKIADELRRSAADNVVNRRWTAAATDAIRAGMRAADAVLIAGRNRGGTASRGVIRVGARHRRTTEGVRGL